MAVKRRPQISAPIIEALSRYGRAASMPTSISSAAGSAIGGLSLADQISRDRERAALLQHGLSTGALKSSTLSGTDKSIVAKYTQSQQGATAGGTPSIDPETGQAFDSKGKAIETPAHGVGGFLENLLGERGLSGVLTHLPEGVFLTGKSLVQDIANAPNIISGKSPSQFEKKILDPTIEGFKYDWGPLFHGDTSTFAKRFYNAPLNPILDIASVASLGSGGVGRVAKLASPQGRLARIVATDTRPGAVVTSGVNRARLGEVGGIEGGDVVFPTIPRFYSDRPLAKLGQIIGDKLVQSRAGTKLGLPGLSENRAINQVIDRSYATHNLEKQMQIFRATRELIKAENQLHGGEHIAVHLALRGVNDAAKVAAYKDEIRRALTGESPEGFNLINKSPDVPDGWAEYQANLPESVVKLIENPTPDMVHFANLWHEVVAGGREDLAAAGTPVDDATHLERTYALQKALSSKGLKQDANGRWRDAHNSFHPGPPTAPGLAADFEASGYPIRPTYVPDISSEGLRFGRHGVARIAQKIPGLKDQPQFEPMLTQGKRSRVGRLSISPETILRAPFQAYLKHSDLDTLLSGTARMDPRVLVNHVAGRVADIENSALNTKLWETLAQKDPHGEPIPFKSQAQVNTAFGKGRFVFFNPELPLRFFVQETDTLTKAIQTIEELRKQGRDVASTEVVDALNSIADEDARAFVQNNLGAVKNEGYAIPRHAYDRIIAHIKVNEPFGWKGAEVYRHFLNVWRTATLAMMPRWMLNTAVGTMFQALLKGTWFNPRNFVRAWRLRGSAELPAGLKLGGLAVGEAIERGGIGNAMGFTRGAYNTVQGIEDFIRSAMGMQSLTKMDRRHLTSIGDILKSFAPASLDDEAWLKRMTQDPRMVDAAIQDLNKFAYNFSALGPLERRYFRQFVPFWGWYKFVTKLIWRLPVEYPGRMRAVAALGEIGQDFENQLPDLPWWVRGSIFMNTNPKALRFLPTHGLNPFSQFMNPFAHEGTIAGLLRLGQTSPLIQAFIAASGIDPLTGDRVQISPQENVGQDFLGRLINLTSGQPTNPGEVAGGRRFISTLLREFPQYRIAEPAFSGGNPVYPESLPLPGLTRPIGVNPGTRRDFSQIGLLLQSLGIAPKTIDAASTSKLNEKAAQYAATRNRNQRKRLSKRLQKR